MTLQVESVIKSFVAIGATVTLVERMRFEMSIEEASKRKGAVANLAPVIMGCGRGFFSLC